MTILYETTPRILTENKKAELAAEVLEDRARADAEFLAVEALMAPRASAKT